MNKNGTIVICGGNARPTDIHLLSTVHGCDEEIWKILRCLERRQERSNRRGRKSVTHIASIHTTNHRHQDRPGVRELEARMAALLEQRAIVVRQANVSHLAVLDDQIASASNQLERLRARKKAS
jgi:hypothetical protein